MPWNDLYGPLRRADPGRMFPPVAVKPTMYGMQARKEMCGGEQIMKYYLAGPLTAFFFLLRLSARLRRKGQKLAVHVHNPVLVYIALLAKMLSPQIQIVGTVHGQWYGFRAHQQMALRLLAAASKRIVLVGKSIRGSLPQDILRRLDKRGALKIIVNGIPSSRLSSTYPLYELKGKRSSDVIAVARFESPKNVRFVIEVFSTLTSADRLIWYGSGSEQSLVVELVRELGLNNEVVFMGSRPRDEVYRALSSSAAFLTCSVTEGLAVACLEAAALGCMPFMSDIPAHREIADALDLDVYPLEDATLWTDALEQAIGEASSGKYTGGVGLARRARNEFNLSKTVASYVDLYQEL